MDFIDSLGKRIDNVVKQVGSKSSELLNIGRINIEILKEQEAIRKLYKEIGVVVYKAYSTNGDYTGIVDAHCSEIGDRLNRITELRDKIEKIKRESVATRKDNGSSDKEGAHQPYDDITDADDESYSLSFEESFDDEETCPHCGEVLTTE